MGVQARIVLYAPDSVAAARAAEAAFARLAALDEVMSDYIRTSELSRLGDLAGGEPVRVSPDLFLVLRRARALHAQTGGAFDVTVGPLAVLWREARRTGRLPPEEDLRAATARVGMEHLILDEDRRTARLAVPGMRLDLGGIAKGYAADEALRVLRRRGARRALVELGGDLAAGDPPPGAPGWLVALENPPPGFETLRIANAAVSTSGDTQQFVEVGGRRYGHVVDPRTGIGITTRAEVTVVARSGLVSDGLATALVVLGPDEGRALLRRHYPGVRAYVRTAP